MKRLWVVVSATLVAASCSSSTAPASSLSPAQIARHIDSLAVEATSLDGYRWEFLVELEGPVAYGAAPVAFDVTTRSGSHEWHGYVSRLSQLSSGDSAFIIFAYSDYAMTNVLLAAVTYTNGQPVGHVSLLASDTVPIVGGSGTVTGATRSTGAACGTTTGLQWGPPVPSAGTCSLGTFDGSVSWTLPTATGANADFQTLNVGLHAFNGVALK
jgi:hypothetical protein